MRRRVFLVVVMCFCMIMPVISIGAEETDDNVSITKTVSVQSAAPGDEVTYTITVSITGYVVVYDLYVLEKPAANLKDVRIENVVGSYNDSGTAVNLDVSHSEEPADGNAKKICIWETGELDRRLSGGSRITITLKAKVTPDAQVGSVINTAEVYAEEAGAYSNSLKDSYSDMVNVIGAGPATPDRR